MRALLVLFLLLGCACGTVPQAGRHPGYDELDQTVVALVDEEGDIYCSGVILDEGILTAAHCVDDQEAVWVAHSGQVSEDGNYMRAARQADVLRTDVEADLALLSTPSGWASWPRLGAQPALGDEIVACGHPARLPFVCQRGNVSGRLRYGRTEEFRRKGWYTVDAGLIPGMSGGPVFDRQGQVVGMISFYIASPLVGCVVDPATIQAFLHTR